MIFPGLDTQSMSDDQIMNRISDLYSKLSFAYGSNSMQMVDQLHAIIESLQFEQYSRSEKRHWEAINKNRPAIIETDPDLGIRNKDDLPKQKKATVGSSRGGLMNRTRSPTEHNPD